VAIRARKGTPIAGAVLGRAIYTGGITATEALKAAK
jgi:phosphoribosylformimino-5-aminoimidazole carboxamide ribonucleotide (ProFAR) isomerase